MGIDSEPVVVIGVPPAVLRSMLSVPAVWLSTDTSTVVEWLCASQSGRVNGKRFKLLRVRLSQFDAILSWLREVFAWIGHDQVSRGISEPDHPRRFEFSNGASNNVVLTPEPSTGASNVTIGGEPRSTAMVVTHEHVILSAWITAIIGKVEEISRLRTDDLVTLIAKCAKVVVANEPSDCVWRTLRV